MAAGNFENCLPIILRFEGGRSNDPADPGGRTNKGITQRTYDAYRTGKHEPHADVYSIADAEVADCYRRDYWDAVNGDSLRPGEDLAVFDFAVNSGPAHALHVWKSAPANPSSDTIRGVCANRLAFMHSLSTWPHFGPGWADRVAKVRKYGLAMAAGKVPAARVKVKPGHAGGAVIVAGGAAVGAAAHWFDSPALIVTIVLVTGALAIYLWSKLTRAHQMTAARAIKPEGIPMPEPASLGPDDAIKTALVKVAAAKDALAAAIAVALKERDARLAQGVALQASVAAAEAYLVSLGVDIAPQPASHGLEQADSMSGIGLIPHISQGSESAGNFTIKGSLT